MTSQRKTYLRVDGFSELMTAAVSAGAYTSRTLRSFGKVVGVRKAGRRSGETVNNDVAKRRNNAGLMAVTTAVGGLVEVRLLRRQTSSPRGWRQGAPA